MNLKLPKWFDLHAHFRQGAPMSAYLRAHREMGCAGVLAMPNTNPPVSRVLGKASETSWSIESYLEQLHKAGGDVFDRLIVPLYITRETTPKMIEEGAQSGLLRACKYYPPHGTTHAHDAMPMQDLIGGDVIKQLEETRTILCIHGEMHALMDEMYFDEQNAESLFYREIMPRLIDAHPRLRIVCEHLSTKAAVRFVQCADDSIAATVTPQHLLFTMGHLLKKLNPHLYCLPIVKFKKDRDALRRAVMKKGQRRFFAGTDSAPHTKKAAKCACAAGCFVGGFAPQMYAMAFEEGGCSLANAAGIERFKRFLCLNGPAFYGFESSKKTFEMKRASDAIDELETAEGNAIPLPIAMRMQLNWQLV